MLMCLFIEQFNLTCFQFLNILFQFLPKKDKFSSYKIKIYPIIKDETGRGKEKKIINIIQIYDIQDVKKSKGKALLEM